MCAPACLRAGCARGHGGVCRGASMTPWPSLRSRAWSGAHMLLIKSSAWLQRQPRPRPGAGVSHTRSPCPTPGAPAQLGNKINPKVSMGAMREGGSKAKGPGRREGSSVPRRWGRAARVSSLPAPHPTPHPSNLQLPPNHPPPAPPCLPWLRQGLLRAPSGPPPPALPQGNLTQTPLSSTQPTEAPLGED